MIITIDGVDRTGKNSLHKYLEQISDYKYVITDRGILTQIAYSKKFNRDVKYNLNNYKDNVIVYLYADKRDLEIRCKMTNEPYFDIDGDTKLFGECLDMLEQNGFIVFRYDTSKWTPYAIANDLKDKLKALEEKML